MPPPAQRGSRSIVWVPLLLVSLAAGFVAGGASEYFYEHHGKESEKPTPPQETQGPVVALGRIEPRDGVLSLGVATPDRILKIEVEEDQLVSKDQPLVTLESQKMRELDKQMADIQLREAATRLDAIKKNGAAQIAVAEVRRDRINKLEPIELSILESKIKLLIKQKKNAARNYDRYVKAGDTIAGMDKEKQELAEQQIETEIADTEAQINKLGKSGKLDLSLAKAQVDAAEAELQQSQSTISLESLDKQVEQAKERLNEAKLLAPSAGKILRVFAHKGDLVQSKPILQMANVDHMIVDAEVDEKDIQRVKKKQAVTITSPSRAFDESVTGKVVWIASYVGKAEMVPLDPRSAVSDRVVHVKVAVDDPKRVATLIGLQVRVEITTKESTEGEK